MSSGADDPESEQAHLARSGDASEASHGDGADEWIELARYASPMPGTLVKTKLEAHGVPVLVRGSQLAFGGLGHPAMSDFRLCIRRGDIERARGLLAEDTVDLSESAYRGAQPGTGLRAPEPPTELDRPEMRGVIIKLAIAGLFFAALALLRVGC